MVLSAFSGALTGGGGVRRDVACNTNLCGCYPQGLEEQLGDSYSALFSTQVRHFPTGVAAVLRAAEAVILSLPSHTVGVSQLGSRCGEPPLPPDAMCDDSASNGGDMEAAADGPLAVDLMSPWSCSLPETAAAEDQANDGTGGLVWEQGVWVHDVEEPCEHVDVGTYAVHDAGAQAQAGCGAGPGDEWALAQFTADEFECQQVGSFCALGAQP